MCWCFRSALFQSSELWGLRKVPMADGGWRMAERKMRMIKWKKKTVSRKKARKLTVLLNTAQIT